MTSFFNFVFAFGVNMVFIFTILFVVLSIPMIIVSFALTVKSRWLRGVCFAIAAVIMLFMISALYKVDATRNFVSLSHASESVKIQNVEMSGIRRYTLLSYNPPKHMYVTIQDVQTKEIFRDVYVAKHCDAKVEVGAEYNIRTVRYTKSDDPSHTQFADFPDLSFVFCN